MLLNVEYKILYIRFSILTRFQLKFWNKNLWVKKFKVNEPPRRVISIKYIWMLNILKILY